MAAAPIFKICSWLDREDYERLKDVAEYLGRRDGCSLFMLRSSVIRSPRLQNVLEMLESLGAIMEPQARKWLEQEAEMQATVRVGLSRQGFVLWSKMYLAELLSKYRGLGLVWYSRRERGFIVRPFAVVDVVEEIRSRGYNVEDTTGLLSANRTDFVFTGRLRPYQAEAVDAWKKNRYRGLVVLPTGAGKTVVALAAMAELRVPTLVVVYTKEQMYEWREKIKGFISTKMAVGLFYGEKKEIKPITIATYQSAYRNIEQLWDKFSLLIIDEAHHLPAERFRSIALHVMAPYRLGLTATPYREDGRHDELFSLMGGVVYVKTLEELKEYGYVARFEIIPRLVRLDREEYEKYRALKQRYNVLARGRSVQELVAASASGDETARKALQLLNEMRKLLALSRNKIEEAKAIVNEELARGSKIIVFTQYVQQAELLGKTLGAPVVTGKTDKLRRRIALELFKKGRYRVLVLTTVGDEGIDIPDANVGIVLSGTSSKRQFIQRLGRLLRPQPGKVAKLYYVAVRGSQEETAMKKILDRLHSLA